jgi:hypothetical protein
MVKVIRNPSELKTFVIGRDLGPAGRLVRILAGLLNLAAAVSIVRVMGPLAAVVVAQMAMAAIVMAVAYSLLVGALGDKLLGRVDPWLAAILVVVPLAVLFAFPFVPDSITVGAFLFIAASQFVQAGIGYGGCEIIGIPTLIHRRRYTVYCGLNSADVVERWLRGRPRWMAWSMALGAFVVTTALGALAEWIGSATAFFTAYLAFLVIGLVVSRILSGQPRLKAI